MIGVVIPAHNEEEHIDATLEAVKRAAIHWGLNGERVEVVLVLDSCSDSTAAIAARHGVRTVAVEARNVGIARAAGADLLLAEGARWLGFTDADTQVSPAWLVRQLALGADAVCGSIGVGDWAQHGAQRGFLVEHFARTYDDSDGHRHVHGANLGVSAAAYRRVGGFAPLACSEDVALVAALQAAGAHIAWSAAPRVTTSARVDARARGGFGDTLLAVVAAAAAATAAAAALIVEPGIPSVVQPGIR